MQSVHRGVGMEERRFDMLVDVLKIMDTETLKQSNLRDGIKHVLNHFNEAFTDNQKNEVMNTLRAFAIRKQDEEDVKRIRHRLDEERYHEMIESFHRTQDVSW